MEKRAGVSTGTAQTALVSSHCRSDYVRNRRLVRSETRFLQERTGNFTALRAWCACRVACRLHRLKPRECDRIGIAACTDQGDRTWTSPPHARSSPTVLALRIKRIG
jgi:hypothetical protein